MPTVTFGLPTRRTNVAMPDARTEYSTLNTHTPTGVTKSLTLVADSLEIDGLKSHLFADAYF